jgi:hypothetical protein
MAHSTRIKCKSESCNLRNKNTYTLNLVRTKESDDKMEKESMHWKYTGDISSNEEALEKTNQQHPVSSFQHSKARLSSPLEINFVCMRRFR